LENAIKYTPDGNNITVSFNEIGNNMEVKFKNLGIRPLDSEIEQLTKRGFRSKKVLDNGFEGSGLGLYLLQKICDSNNVKLQIETEKEKMKGGGITYSDFIVTLTFSEDYIC
jgi:signal transduction histidine kinase